MALGLVVDAATQKDGSAVVGVIFGELLSAVLQVKDNARAFRPKLMQLEETLRKLKPVIKDIEELNRQLNQADQFETESLRRLMEEGKNLVFKCSQVGWWNILKKSRYKKKLVELDNKIVRFHDVDMQAFITREVMRMRLELDKLSRRGCWPKLAYKTKRRTVH